MFETIKAGCLTGLALLTLLVAAGAYYVYVDVPRRVVFQQVPEGLAASRSFQGAIQDVCGAVTVALSDDATAEIKQRGLAAFNMPKFKIAVPSAWNKTPYVPRFKDQWGIGCGPSTYAILRQIDATLSREGAFVWEGDEGIVVVDPAQRTILNKFFYK